MSKRVLMIAYYFPPLGGIGSLRAMRFAEHLPEFGWEPTVVAPRLGTHHEDPELSFPEERVIRSRSLELSRLGKRALSIEQSEDGSLAEVRGARALLRSFAHRYLYRPDPQIGWYPGAVRAARKALEEKRYDAIFSTSVPMTSHLIARRLRRSSRLPWVAEFRDPWSARGAEPRSGSAERLELSVATAACEVVMTSPTWARVHSEKWGRQVTPIVAGADAAPAAAATPGLTVTHLGSLYPDEQDLSAAWIALRRIIDANEVASVRVRFIGEIPSAVREQLGQHGLIEFTESTGFVPHDRALEQLAESSVLLAAGGRDGRDSLRGLIPAKLLEYLGTELPVIYVTHLPNDGAELLDGQPGCHVLGVGDPAGI